jgi:hypothetical protein
VELRRPRLRLERAELHQREFGRTWNEFLAQGDPYVPVVAVAPNGKGSIYVDVDSAFPREQLALQFGEMLYQLRAALDSLVYEVAIRDSREDPPPDAENLEFLVRSSKDAFDKAAWKIRPLSDQHRLMIESIQPYDNGNRGKGEALVAEAFEMLNDLARKDRHRGIRVIASWISNQNPQIVTLPPGCTVDWIKPEPDGLLDDDGKVATFKIGNWRPGLHLEANPNCAIDVTVEDAPPPVHDEDTLAARSRLMIACVSEVIRGFEETLN